MNTPYFHCQISYIFSALTSVKKVVDLKSETIEGLHNQIRPYEQMEDYRVEQTISYRK